VTVSAGRYEISWQAQDERPGVADHAVYKRFVADPEIQ
jgi:hypothetical protein